MMIRKSRAYGKPSAGIAYFGLLAIFNGCLLACDDQGEDLNTFDLSVDMSVRNDADMEQPSLDLTISADQGEQSGNMQAGDMAGTELAVNQICEVYTTSLEAYTLSEHRLPEASGLAFSQISAHSLWSHNDSGDQTRVFALSDQGQVLGEMVIDDQSQDLEDIDVARCPHLDRSCLWLGDVGDNQAHRDYLSLYIFPEPPTGLTFDPINKHLLTTGGDVLKISFRLEDGPADIEALSVHHEGQSVWLFEKIQGQASRVWQLQLSASELEQAYQSSEYRLQARLVTEFQAPGIPVEHGQKITATDLSPQGDHLLVRVYTGIYEYDFTRPYAFDELPTTEPNLVLLGPLSEPQGEALSYGWQGRGIWSISESQQAVQDLHYLGCESD